MGRFQKANNLKRLLILLLLLNFPQVGAQPPICYAADSLVQLGKYAEAISVYENINPPSGKIYLKIAQAYRAQGNLGKAIQNYELAFSNHHFLPAAEATYGELLAHAHQFQKAERVFQNLVNRYPANPDFHYQLGLAKQALEDSTATQEFRLAYSLDSGHQKAIYQLARYQFKQKNYSKVESLGKKALESYAQNPKIIALLGQNSMKLEDYPLAVQRFETLISLQHSPLFVYENLALAYYHLGELQKALDQYEIILATHPKHITAYFHSGKIYDLLGEYEKAAPFLQKAVALKKRGLDRMYQAMGINYSLRQKYGEAIEAFKRALEENPENIRAQYELAVAADNYYKELQTRLNYYKIFVQKFEEHPGATPFLPFVRSRIGQLKKEKFMESPEKEAAEQPGNLNRNGRRSPQ